jgi:hypothetical protein
MAGEENASEPRQNILEKDGLPLEIISKMEG